MIAQYSDEIKWQAGASWLGQVGKFAILPRIIPNCSLSSITEVKMECGEGGVGIGA